MKVPRRQSTAAARPRWSERCVAALFTAEYVARWVAPRRWLYPLRPMAVVELLAILPFYVGFFVGLRSLRLVRTLSVLRLFKLTRQGRALAALYNAFHRIRHEFAVIGFALFIVCWCSAVVSRKKRPADVAWQELAPPGTTGAVSKR